MTKAQRDIKRKLLVLRTAQENGNISKTCRYFGISRQCFYDWKKAYRDKGEVGLINSKPCPQNPNLRVPEDIERKILYLRKTYHLGPQRIAWYLDRYHQVKVSAGGVRGVLVRNGLNRLPRNTKTRTITTRRYQKQVPGHHIQIDVKFLTPIKKDNKQIKRYQYTAIDDATRIRALKIYTQHTQQNAIDFVNYVVSKFPFRIQTIRTDNGHEFQAQFHWHVEDLGIRHVYIKPRTPRLNGKVERSHKTDDREFYQLFSYTDDVDLNKRLTQWEDYYNFDRPHGALNGRTPYEALRSYLTNPKNLSTEI